MSKYKGLFTFDVDNHRYVSIAQADGIIDCMDYDPSELAEPLIKDENIRKAVRAWAEANDVGVVRVAPFAVFDIETSACIYFYGRVIEDKDYDEKKSCTIAELCGEEEE